MTRNRCSLKTRALLYGVFAIAAIFLFVVTACSSGVYQKQDSYGGVPAENEAPAPMLLRSESVAADSVMAVEDEFIMESDTSSEPVPENSDMRKRIYNGSAGLVVEDLEKTRKSLEDLTTRSNGYVEQSYRDYLVLRIPAEQFDTIFARILGMGSVKYQSVETWDVTDQYADIQARLTTAEATRERLYTLLERSTDPEERARILREIGRLTEEIESIKQQVQILDSRIAFSRITVELIPRLQEDRTGQDIPFGWIESLNPLSPVSDKLKARMDLNPGEDFAVFAREDIYLAEDASGTSISVSSVENSPRGDSLFWQKALVHYLSGYYASYTEKELSFGDKELKGVEFVSKDTAPYRYFVGVAVDKDDLHIVEIFSPRSDRDFSDLYKALKEGECR